MRFINNLGKIMGKSRKKTPIVKERDSAKYWKKVANKKVRKISMDYLVSSKSKDYKKVYDSWNIQDYAIYCSLKQMLSNRENGGYSKSEIIEYWKKVFFRK